MSGHPIPPKAGPMPAHVTRGQCVHYTGFFDYDADPIKKCNAGVEYRQLATGRLLNTLPCASGPLPSTVPCASCKLPDDAAVEAFEKWLKAHNTILLYAAFLCRLDAGDRRGIRGEIKCPECDGRLHYTVAGSNGHLWGSCEKAGCLSWLQ